MVKRGIVARTPLISGGRRRGGEAENMISRNFSFGDIIIVPFRILETILMFVSKSMIIIYECENAFRVTSEL